MLFGLVSRTWDLGTRLLLTSVIVESNTLLILGSIFY